MLKVCVHATDGRNELGTKTNLSNVYRANHILTMSILILSELFGFVIRTADVCVAASAAKAC